MSSFRWICLLLLQHQTLHRCGWKRRHLWKTNPKNEWTTIAARSEYFSCSANQIPAAFSSHCIDTLTCACIACIIRAADAIRTISVGCTWHLWHRFDAVGTCAGSGRYMLPHTLWKNKMRESQLRNVKRELTSTIIVGGVGLDFCCTCLGDTFWVNIEWANTGIIPPVVDIGPIILFPTSTKD